MKGTAVKAQRPTKQDGIGTSFTLTSLLCVALLTVAAPVLHAQSTMDDALSGKHATAPGPFASQHPSLVRRVQDPPQSAVEFTVDDSIGCNMLEYDGYDVTVNGAVLTLDCEHSFNSLEIVNGGSLTHSAVQVEGLRLNIATNLIIDDTSTVDVNGRGFAPTQGPGAGSASYCNASGEPFVGQSSSTC